MTEIIMNINDLFVAAFPKLKEDRHVWHIVERMKTEEKISLIAKEVCRLRSELSREVVGRKRRDAEIERLKQLEFVHNAINYGRTSL